MFQDFFFCLFVSFSCSGSFNIPSILREIFHYGTRWSPWKWTGSWRTGRPYCSKWGRFADLRCKWLLMVTQHPSVLLKEDASYLCVDSAENLLQLKLCCQRMSQSFTWQSCPSHTQQHSNSLQATLLSFSCYVMQVVESVLVIVVQLGMCSPSDCAKLGVSSPADWEMFVSLLLGLYAVLGHSKTDVEELERVQ